MLQLHVDDIIITVQDLSPITCELQHDHEKFVTMQSVGSDNIPLHRDDLACSHHLTAVPTGTFHGTHPYDGMGMIKIPMMGGISWKLASHRKAHNCMTYGTERTRNPTNCVDTHIVLVHSTFLSNKKIHVEARSNQL
jgi:hypothetical protein